MKKYLLIATALAFTMCCKKTNSIDAELAKLPPITQTGANTFGCLVNGVAVTPNSSCLGCPPPYMQFMTQIQMVNLVLFVLMKMAI